MSSAQVRVERQEKGSVLAFNGIFWSHQTGGKNMKKLVFCMMVFFIGCNFLSDNAFGKDLARPQATKILKNLNYGDVTRDLMLNRQAGYWAGVFQCPGSTHQDGTEDMLRRLQPIEDVYNSLSNAGFITFTKEISDPSIRPQEQYNCDSKTYIFYTVNTTPKLNKYITFNNGNVIKLKLIDYVFDKITGISKESKTTSIVEFTVKAKTNELSNHFGLKQNELATQSRRVYFKLYDDGWRIVQ